MKEHVLVLISLFVMVLGGAEAAADNCNPDNLTDCQTAPDNVPRTVAVAGAVTGGMIVRELFNRRRRRRGDLRDDVEEPEPPDEVVVATIEDFFGPATPPATGGMDAGDAESVEEPGEPGPEASVDREGRRRPPPVRDFRLGEEGDAGSAGEGGERGGGGAGEGGEP